MHKYTVEFRIEGSALLPSEVTTLLGLQPCQVRDVDIEAGRKNRGKALWVYDGFGIEANPKHEWTSLEDGLLFLLERLEPKQNDIQLRLDEFEKYWWCGHFQQSFDGGPTFSPELFKRLGSFGVPLMLDNYFSEEN